MRAPAIIATALLTAGCSVISHRDTAVAFAYAGAVADTQSTRIKLDEGCHEGNPLYGSKQPSDARLAVGLAATAAAIYWLDNHSDSPTWFLWAVGALKAGVAYRNMQVECKGDPR